MIFYIVFVIYADFIITKSFKQNIIEILESQTLTFSGANLLISWLDADGQCIKVDKGSKLDGAVHG